MKVKMMPSGALMVNTYLVTDEETKKGFIVDPGGYDANLANLVRSEDVTIEYIVLTHGHADHIGGVEAYRKIYPDVKVVCAKAEVATLSDPRLNISWMMGQEISITPDITVTEGETLGCGNMTMKFTMTPGHSPGGMCIIMEGENVVFSGDTLFCMSIGRTDFPGCSFEELMKSIEEKLMVLPDDTVVYPGHMGETRIGLERQHNPFIM